MASRHQLRRPGTALDDVRNALQAAGHSIRPRGPDAFMASCPGTPTAPPPCRSGGATIPAPGLAERSCCTALLPVPRRRHRRRPWPAPDRPVRQPPRSRATLAARGTTQAAHAHPH